MKEKEKETADNLEQKRKTKIEPETSEQNLPEETKEKLGADSNNDHVENEIVDGEDNVLENQLLTYEELSMEVIELKDQLLRTVAESEHVRRRMEREKVDSSKYAITNFARSILSVADNLNRALESVTPEARATSEELDNLVLGIEMTGKEFDNVYEKFEIRPIDALGKKFDHNLHQAMFELDDPNQPAGIVLQQIQKGYTILDRLLRPAMVGVSKGGPALEDKAKNEDVELETLPPENAAKETSSAYAKQADATKTDKKTSLKLDKEL